MRAELPHAFPGSLFYFQTADIVSQVLNFGLSAPIDVQIQDANFDRSYVLAQQLLRPMQADSRRGRCPYGAGAELSGLKIDVDRLRAAEVGVTQRDVANNC